MDSMWYCRERNAEVGPFSVVDMQDRAKSGRLNAADFVRGGDEDVWSPAGVRPELAQFFNPLSPIASSVRSIPPTASTAATSKPIWPWLVAFGGGVAVLMLILVVLAVVMTNGSQSSSPDAPAVNPIQTTIQNATTGPIVTIEGVDATPELSAIVAQMTDAQKLNIGYFLLTTGEDFYAARVRIINSGDQSVYITPDNIRLHLNGETISVLPTTDPRFLQSTTLDAKRYIEGLVAYRAYVAAGAAMRLGAGRISYVQE